MSISVLIEDNHNVDEYMTLKLVNTIAQRAADRDGFSEADRREISGLGRTKAERAKIYKALDAFIDLIVTKRELGKFAHQLKLNSNARSRLMGIVGHDGMSLLRKQFADNPGVAHAKLVDPKASAKVRAAAAAHIGKGNDPLAVHVLTKALKTERDWSVRFAIAKALIKVDSRTRKRSDVITILVTAYRKGDAGVRRYALSKLRDVRTRAVTDIFIDASKHRNPTMRHASVRVLAKKDDSKAKVALLKALKDTDERVRAAVPRSLALEVARVKGLLKLLRSSKTKPENRDYLIKKLSQVKEPVALVVIAELAKLVKDRNVVVRWSAVKILTSFRGENVVDALLPFLNDRKDKIRLMAVKHFAKMGSIRGLVAALTNRDGSIRYRAITRLKDMRDRRLVPIFAKSLRDPLAIIRKTATQGLGNTKDPSATHTLIAALRDGDKSVRWAAAQALGKIGPAAKAAIPELVKRLRDPFTSVCDASADALKKIWPGSLPVIAAVKIPALIKADFTIGGAFQIVLKDTVLTIGPKIAIPILVKILGDRNEHEAVRGRAAIALSLFGARAASAVPALIKSTTLPEKGHYRICVSHALRKIGNAAAAPALIKSFGDPNRKIREFARGAFPIHDSKVSPLLVKALRDRNKYVRLGAAVVMTWYHEFYARKVSVPILIECLGESEFAKIGAIGLGKKGTAAKAAVPALKKALRNRDKWVRYAAAVALSKIDTTAKVAIPVLIKSLHDRKPGYKTQEDAIEALGRFGPAAKAAVPLLIQHGAIRALGDIGPAAKAAVPQLKKYLFSDSTEEAAIALRKISGRALVPWLTKRLRNRDEDIRLKAARALSLIDPTTKAAIPVLIKTLGHSCSWSNRRNAAEALVKFKDPRVVPALITALKDKEKYVRDAAAHALGAKKDPRIVPALIAALKNTSTEAELIKIGVLAVPKLIVALKNTDDRVREGAARVLGKIGDRRAVPALIPLIKVWGLNNVHLAAAVALGRLKARRAVPGLIAMLKYYRWVDCMELLIALKKIGDPRAVPVLLDVVWSGTSQKVRNAAEGAILSMGVAAVPKLIIALEKRNPSWSHAAAELLRKMKIGTPKVKAALLRYDKWEPRTHVPRNVTP